jgi:hypothetical protein
MNSLKKMNAIAYPKLSPHERFKKFIKAYAENDIGLCKKLVDSCPKYTYIESDYAYTERVQASNDIISIFLLQLLEYDKVIAIVKILGLVNVNSQLSEIYGFILAFEQFCVENLGVAPEILIQAWYGYDERYLNKINHIKDFLKLNHIEPDEEKRKVWLESVFSCSWEHRING